MLTFGADKIDSTVRVFGDIKQMDELLIIGEAIHIQPIYKAIYRAWQNDKTAITPSHLGKAQFREGDIYGLDIVWDENWHKYVMYVVTAQTILNRLFINEDSIFQNPHEMPNTLKRYYKEMI